MPKTQVLDTSTESQSIDQPNRRTIYDAGFKEIFLKSFVAGIGLGIGRMIATLIFFGIILGIFVTYIEPWLMNISSQFENIIPGFLIPTSNQPSNNARFQNSDEDQLFDVFSTLRPAPQESIEATETTTTQ